MSDEGFDAAQVSMAECPVQWVAPILVDPACRVSACREEQLDHLVVVEEGCGDPDRGVAGLEHKLRPLDPDLGVHVGATLEERAHEVPSAREDRVEDGRDTCRPRAVVDRLEAHLSHPFSVRLLLLVGHQLRTIEQRRRPRVQVAKELKVAFGEGLSLSSGDQVLEMRRELQPVVRNCELAAADNRMVGPFAAHHAARRVGLDGTGRAHNHHRLGRG